MVTLRDAIPEFDGTNVPLEEFLEGCRDAASIVGGNNEENLVKFLKLRIKDKAKRSIKDEDFANVRELEDFLRKMFLPPQTVPQLLGELGRQYQRDDQSVLSFANRIRNPEKLQIKPIRY